MIHFQIDTRSLFVVLTIKILFFFASEGEKHDMISTPGLSMNGLQLHLGASTHASIYLGVLLFQVKNFIWLVNCTPTLQQVCSVILLQIIHLQLHDRKWALQFIVDVDCRHCYIGQKFFCFKFELFSFIVIHISLCHTN